MQFLCFPYFFIIKFLKLPKMEEYYQFLSFSNLFIFLLFVFIIILRTWRKSKTPNLPPGPPKLPLIGNMHSFLGSLPHHCLRDLAQNYGPLMHLQLGEVSNYVISSPEVAKQVMKNLDINFAQRPFLQSVKKMTYNHTDIAFAPYGEYWRQLRKICTLELFSMKRVQSFGPIRQEEMSNLISIVSSKAGLQINLSKMLLTLTNDIVTRAAFGGKCKDRNAIVPAIKKMVELADGFSIVDMLPSIGFLDILTRRRSQLDKVCREVDNILENIINEHRASENTGELGEADDLVNVLLNLQGHKKLQFPLTNDNIKAVIQDVFVAGSETSATTIEWAMSEMLRNPRVMKKAQAEVRQVFDRKGSVVDEASLHELEYLKLVIKETLRLHPPVPLLVPRECRERCKINGYEIPLGSRVIVNAWAIGRDPDYWNESESFNPERFIGSSIDYKGTDFEYIPFGAGRRICPGMSFGIANIELPLAQLLYHFNWKLPNGTKNENLDMTEAFGGAVGRKNNLHIIPYHYVPSE